MADEKPQNNTAGNNDAGSAGPSGPSAPAGKESGGGPDESAGGVDPGSRGGLTSPEGVLMLSVAVFFDIIGIILNICFDLNIISDIFATFIIGFWSLSRTGDIMSSFKKSNGKKGEAVEDMIKKIAKKFGMTYVIKIIPEVGSLFSYWTYRVYKELKNS